MVLLRLLLLLRRRRAGATFGIGLGWIKVDCCCC
jgi:hypothetical protein